MSGGKWTGQGQARRWVRPGSRRIIPGDPERGERLAAGLARERFWCERCGGTHELRNMGLCCDYSHRDVR
jgi:hypothetical protein